MTTTQTRATAWWNLVTGLLWLFEAARDAWFPRFLSMTGGRHGNVLMEVCVGAVFVSAAGVTFVRRRSDATQTSIVDGVR